jgi:hypothetical protein
MISGQVSGDLQAIRRSTARTYTRGSVTWHGVRLVLLNLRIHIPSVLNASGSLSASGGTRAELAYDLDQVMKVALCRRMQPFQPCRTSGHGPVIVAAIISGVVAQSPGRLGNDHEGLALADSPASASCWGSGGRQRRSSTVFGGA